MPAWARPPTPPWPWSWAATACCAHRPSRGPRTRRRWRGRSATRCGPGGPPTWPGASPGACTQRPPRRRPGSPSSPMTPADAGVVPVAASGFLAAFSGRDPGAFAAHCDPGIHYEDPFTGTPLRGCDELAEHAKRLWEAFPDARVERAGIPPAARAAIAMPFRLEGTHRAPVGGLPATGRRISVHGIVYAEPAADGRLLRARAFFDVYDAGVQLGVLPAHGGLAE